MYIAILLILINIISVVFIKRKDSSENLYTKEKNYFIKNKIKLVVKLLNIEYIIINLIYYLILLINNNNFNVIELVLFGFSVITGILVFSLSIPNKYELINDKYITKREMLYILSILLISLTDRLNATEELVSGVFVICSYIVISLILLFSLFIIIKYIFDNRDITCNMIPKDEYLEDIRFANKIQLNKIGNYIIFLLAYISFVFIQIPYIFIFYILLGIILLYIIFNKIKKIRNQSNKLYNNITIANSRPGLIYAFQFTRDVLLLKRLIILIILFCVSITSLYALGESSFAIISIEIYFILLYILLEDKRYLIRYTYSLNESLINKKVYSIKVNKKISYIDIISLFNIKLYRFIIIDNMIYKSNIILYDPELIEDNINILIKKDNLNNYITLESNLYEEKE